MPYFSNIKIDTLRNLGSVELKPNRFANIIYGENGSGKTSILEALSVIAHGRSFRTRKYQYVINKEKPSYILFAQLLNTKGSNKPSNVGVLRNRQGAIQIKVDGEKILSAGHLAQKLPMLIIDGHSFQLLEGAAKERRQFFDWLVFHVKHDFGKLWKEYAKCVKQRNSLLRRDKINYTELAPWDFEIAKSAAIIESERRKCFTLFSAGLKDYLEECEFDDNSIVVTYKSGWKTDFTNSTSIAIDSSMLEKELKDNFTKDRVLGYTSIGSHKSDIVITVNGKKASESLSRGQQKVLISALFFTKAQVFNETTNIEPVFLLDDLPAELDQRHQALIAKWLVSLGSQSFITSIEKESVLLAWPKMTNTNCQLFHVEHGDVQQEKI